MFDINGLIYIPSYISQYHHDFLVNTIDQSEWRTNLKRRTQHYGYIYDYKAKRVDASMALGPLPVWLHRIAKQLYLDGLIDCVPDQAIINEYEPGQGIADHVDCEPCFGERIFSLSLCSVVVMDLKCMGQQTPIFLEPCSLLMLSGEARHNYTHGIAARKSDTVGDVKHKRGRRLSITFRKVTLS